MKKLILTILPLFVMFSCADLDVSPKTGSTANNIFADPIAYKQYLAKLYASLSLTGLDGPAGNTDLTIILDEGFTSYIRSYWKAQELTTDEAVIAWTDAGIQDLNTHTWSSENQFVRVLYYRIFYLISLTNDFLRQSTPDVLDEYGIGEDARSDIENFREEARFLRALAYWHALDLFRNVPLVTTISADFPSQATPQQVFDFIESELAEIEPSMAEPRENEYGRADKAAVWMLQANLFLNAEVYVGTDRYADVISACEKVIAAGYTLNPLYQANFMADNHTSPELIFTLPADGVSSQSYGSTTFLIHGSVGGEIMAPADYGIDGGWAGLRMTEVAVNIFPDITGTTDSRAIFFTEGQTLEIDVLTEFTQGYAVPKFVNITSADEVGSSLTFVDTDYPMFRLADAYLMYAEAFLRGGGGDEATALGYINELRERAYGGASGNIVAADLTLDFILDERVREMYWEGTRRIDLIRFGQYTDQGIWPWKGGVAEGQVTSAHLNIFPIPASDLIANPNLEQNPGY